MQKQLLVSVHQGPRSRTFLFDPQMGGKLWVSLEERPSESNAVACLHACEEGVSVAPAHDTTLSLGPDSERSTRPFEMEAPSFTVLYAWRKQDAEAIVLRVRMASAGIGQYARYAMEPASMVIGRHPSCGMRYNDPFVSARHACLTCGNEGFVLRDLRSGNGTLVNGVPVEPLQERWLQVGDVVQVIDLTIMVGAGFLYMNHPDGLCSCKLFRPHECGRLPRNGGQAEPWWDDSMLPRYFSAPRLVRTIRPFELHVEAPPQPQADESRSAFERLGPSVVMGIASLAMLVPLVLGALDGGSMRTLLPSATMCLSMMCCAVVMPAYASRAGRRRREEAEKLRCQRYMAYLDDVESKLLGESEEQSRALCANRLGMARILERTRTNSSLLMNSDSSHPDFLELRVGVGEQDMLANVSWPSPGMSTRDDVLMVRMLDLQARMPRLANVPLVMGLLEHCVVGVLGNRQMAWEFVRGMLVQVCALYTPRDVRILMVVDEGERDEWEFLLPLPHVYEVGGTGRLVATTMAGIARRDAYIDGVIAKAKGSGESDERHVVPFHVVVCANRSLSERSRGIGRLLGMRLGHGHSVLFVGEELCDLPHECGYLVCLCQGHDRILESMEASDAVADAVRRSGRSACMFERGDVLNTLRFFEPDALVTQEDARTFARGLARRGFAEDGQRKALPESVGFLQLFRVGSVEQLEVGRRWKNSRASHTLSTPIGISAQGGIVYLDLHEKAQGPHGLIAGTTGSGKSELIVAYVLSMCASYPPDEVAFVLIDYKGGGLAGSFDNARHRLPHLAGTITNLDGSGIRRSLASIRSELKRRQAMLKTACNVSGEPGLDVYSYQALRRQGVLSEPMPHLFIVADEFAELRQQEPEFMEELVSAARIGRSLGIHLVLATQRPTGVVDDQIWSNARFKISLKVADATDSREMIRTDDAARIKRPGHFFLLVGYGEEYVEGQAAYAGCSYVPSKRFEPRRDDAVELLDVEGNVLEKVVPRHTWQEEAGSQMDAVLACIEAHASRRELRARRLWLDPLPKHLPLEEFVLLQAEDEDRGLECVVGLVDDPEDQRQFAYSLDLSQADNIAIYGSNSADCENLLVCMAVELARRFDAGSVWMYAVDYGSGRLGVLDCLPQFGGIVRAGDEEGMQSLLRLLTKEMDRRKEVAESSGGVLCTGDARGGVGFAHVIVLMSNAGALGDSNIELGERIALLARDAPCFGIHLVMSASSVDAICMRLRACMGASVAFSLNDEGEYVSVFGRSVGFSLGRMPGRGLVRIGEHIYEFQSPSLCEEGQSVRDRLCKLVPLSRRSQQKGAPQIPRIPTHVRREHMLRCGLTGLPVGYSKRDVLPVCIDHASSTSVLVVGNDAEALKQYARAACDFLSLASASCAFVDTKGVLAGSSAAFLEDAKEIRGCLEAIERGELVLDVLMVIDPAHALEDIGPDTSPLLERLMEHGNDSGAFMTVIVSEAWSVRSLYASWYQMVLARECGVWVGPGFMDQSLFHYARARPEFSNAAGVSDGFLVMRGEVEAVRLIEPECTAHATGKEEA